LAADIDGDAVKRLEWQRRQPQMIAIASNGAPIAVGANVAGIAPRAGLRCRGRTGPSARSEPKGTYCSLLRRAKVPQAG
jgi:hypothetical protein